MTTTTFPEIKHHARISGTCAICGKANRRVRKFSQTLSPFNQNAQGKPKLPEEIRAELVREAEAWTPDSDRYFKHASCEPKVWFNPEAEYVGATGVWRIQDFATLLWQRRDDLYIYDQLGLEETALYGDFAEALKKLDIRTEFVSRKIFMREDPTWEMNYPAEIGQATPRGFIRVTGFNI